MSRFMGWPGVHDCHGYRRHAICILSNGDLNHVTKQPYFFANKFQLIDDPVAYSCMEDWYARRHQRENHLTKAHRNLVLDMTPYCEHLYKRSCGNIYKGCENFLREQNDQISLSTLFRKIGNFSLYYAQKKLSHKMIKSF